METPSKSNHTGKKIARLRELGNLKQMAAALGKNYNQYK